MKRILVVAVALVALCSLFGLSANAADTTTPTCCVSPPPLPSSNWTGNWTMSVHDARDVTAAGSRQPINQSFLPFYISSSQVNSDGVTMSASGSVTGYANSWVNLFQDPRTGITEVYAYIPMPLLAGMNPEYLLIVHGKFFSFPYGNMLYGTMDATYQDNTGRIDGVAVSKTLYHGDADMFRVDGRG